MRVHLDDAVNPVRCLFFFVLLTLLSFPSEGSPAASAYHDTVQKIYIGYYQRPADPAGLIYWAGRLDATGGNLNEIINAFATSTEAQGLYGTIGSGNISTVVNDIYRALLNRDADQGGRNYYVEGFNAGRFTAATIMLNILYGATGGVDLQSVNNKLAGANLFTKTIDPELDGTDFQATYSGDGDAVAGRNFLALYATATKVPTQDETTAYVRTNIADSGDVITILNPYWSQTLFRNTAPAEPRHVNRVVTEPSGRVHAAWYTQGFEAYMSYSDDKGVSWTHNKLERMTQVHQLIRVSDGTLVAGGESVGSAPMLWYSKDSGKTWSAGASATGTAIGLPNAKSSIIWDLAERLGEVIVTTSAETNPPTESHPVVYAWNPSTNALRALGALRGMGALAVAVKSDGTIYVSTQDSAEHDDPATAGEGRVYYSTNGGGSWTQTGTLASANRIYALTALSDGSLAAGSGLNGAFYHSVDGNSWSLKGTLPQGQRMVGDPPVATTYSVTRVYKIIELASGALLVGTGNNTGDIFLTCDKGASWIKTAETGSNNVAWGLAQAADGTIWIGNGSVQGDVWKAAPPDTVSASRFYSCSR